MTIDRDAQSQSAAKPAPSRQESGDQIILQGFGGYEDEDSEEEVKEEGVKCYLKTKNDHYKKHWMVLTGNELRFYVQKGDEQHKVMHCLQGTYLVFTTMAEIEEKQQRKQQKGGAAATDDQTSHAASKTGQEEYFPIKLVIPPNRSRFMFFKKESVQLEWINKLQTAMGNADVLQFYTLGKTLGEGTYGKVKLATHNESGKKYAVKEVAKKKMSHMQMFQQMKEIEVLKMSQHPNIIKLVDLFENGISYHIVLEYMTGGDLYAYFQAFEFNLSEKRVCEIIYQILQGLQYLHSYGIVHRDLKLENVMMTNKTSGAVPKLVDFGLSKMIGPSELAQEPFGTLGYVAPEILESKLYTSQCDLWSIGCITHALICGTLPFDDPDRDELIRITCCAPFEFTDPVWRKISASCKDLVHSLLAKNPEERISLDAAMAHEWFSSVRSKYTQNITRVHGPDRR